MVLVIVNNQWAISVPRSKQNTRQDTGAKRHRRRPGAIQVDGNDIIAAAGPWNRPLSRRAQGRGATVIEMITYRLSDHTTADDATRYRDSEEVDEAWKHEPIIAPAHLPDGGRATGMRHREDGLAGGGCRCGRRSGSRVPGSWANQASSPCSITCTPNCRTTWQRSATQARWRSCSNGQRCNGRSSHHGAGLGNGTTTTRWWCWVKMSVSTAGCFAPPPAWRQRSATSA